MEKICTDLEAQYQELDDAVSDLNSGKWYIVVCNDKDGAMFLCDPKTKQKNSTTIKYEYLMIKKILQEGVLYIPSAIIASATLLKPAMFAPST